MRRSLPAYMRSPAAHVPAARSAAGWQQALARPRGSPSRRGSALLLVLLLTAALAALALASSYLTANSRILASYYDRERDFRYAAEGALALGKARLARDTSIVLADTGYQALATDQNVKEADGSLVRGVKVDLYAGRTGNATGQYGLNASLVAVARDGTGARYMRRLELAEENFAKFLDFSDKGTTACYAKGEYMYGPVWSNGNIYVCSWLPGAVFTDEVGTAKAVVNKSSGVFSIPPKEWQPRIELPTNSRLARLATYAARGNFDFDAPNNGSASTVRMRIEFVPVDLDGDGDFTDANEGFFRVFEAKSASALRADATSSVIDDQCGDWHMDPRVNQVAFFPVSVHQATWFRDGIGTGDYRASARTVLSPANDPRARCYLAGDPHLAAVERKPGSWSLAARQVGGTDTTFTPTGNLNGQWLSWTTRGGAVPAPLAALGRPDAQYLFPLAREFNLGAMGVIYVNGTVGLSGVLRGRLTVYSYNGDAVFLDDLTYSVDPSSANAQDMLGVIAGKNAIIADNTLNTPVRPSGAPRYYWLDGAVGPDNSPKWLAPQNSFYLHGVVMALNDTFMPEDYWTGPNGYSTVPITRCNGYPVGRGCLFQTGGAIVARREATFTGGGQGMMEARIYDKRTLSTPPPYFPTTGRYLDNRYYEVDPVVWGGSEAQLGAYFAKLTPPAP